MPFDFRSHIIHLVNEGRLKDDGSSASTSPADLERIITQDLPRAVQGWRKPRVMLYAHGGVVGAQDAIAYVESVYPVYLRHEIYPLFFIWRSDARSSLMGILEDTWEDIKRKAKAPIGDEIRDWVLEQTAHIAVKPLWDQMKDNAQKATTNPQGGARQVAQLLAQLAEKQALELHLVGHSAGSIFHAPLLRFLTHTGPDGLGVARCLLYTLGAGRTARPVQA